jgi:pyruvate ferredoxin oxidoreductase alpha subunit
MYLKTRGKTIMVKQIEEASKAVAEAVKLCRPQVIPIYPITPQTHNAEGLAEYVNNGELDAEIIHVESEHSAMSAAIGSCATGARTYTATSSQGLKLMSEMVFVAAGMRLPIVMMVANRALSAPINIWADHSDSLAERDSGWIQLYAESTQEAVDRAIMSFKVAEKTLVPVMFCLDGFILTHVYENVDMPSQKEVDSFLPKLKMPFILDPKKPVTMGPVGGPDSYFEIKLNQHQAVIDSLKVIKQVQKDFTLKFKRKWDIIETYKTKDAEKIIVCMGTACGTSRAVIDDLRAKGQKVGMLKISLFRPFPSKEIIFALKSFNKLKTLIVLDRALSVGNKGVLSIELRDALYDTKIPIKSYIIGLGGRDITKSHIQKAFSLKNTEFLT